MKYTWQVMQECLRLQPAVEVGFRECIKEFEYEGFTIPKGWRVSFNNNKLLVCYMFQTKVEALTNCMV
jgi:cytochrome P450 family 26 subfamily A